MDAYLKLLNELAEFSEFTADLKAGKTPVSVLGVSDSVRAHLISCACRKLNAGGLAVTATADAAKRLYSDLKYFTENDVDLFPETELMFYDAEARGRDVTKARLELLRRLTSAEKPMLVVTSAEAVTGFVPPPEVFKNGIPEFEVGLDIELETAAKMLTSLGYKREEMVEGEGQFSIRGGILDIYPCAGEYDAPARIEFFDTEVDSIRLFDPQSQRTTEKIDKISIYPVRELLLSDEQRAALVLKLKSLISGTDKSDERGQKLAKSLKRDAERIEQGMYFPSLDKYIPYIYDKLPCLLDYIPSDYIIFWDEPAAIEEAVQKNETHMQEELCRLTEYGVLHGGKYNYYTPYKEIMHMAAKGRLVGISGISRSAAEYRPARTHSFTVKSLNGFQGKLDFLTDALRFYKQNIYRTIILAGSQVRAENLAERLDEEGIRCSYQQKLTELPAPGGIVVTHGSIQRGFEYPLIRAAIIGDREIFGEEKKKRRRLRGKTGEKISGFTDLKPGDYIVHQNHGIGQYTGITRLNVDGVQKDYLKIQYKGTDILYVPADQLDMVFKYSGGGTRIKLNKLGGTEWNATRQRVKAATADMAKKLIALYAKRSNSTGIAFDKDTEWQRNFEASFPYEETSDQLRSIEEVKADMEKPCPMDRLLCGDVGYGKTEVAMRAAFKAVMSGYQVAYLVPTTILAAQHYNNFKQRMLQYPIQVDMLSRFTTGAYKKSVLKELETGETDIVIGTHKLLGKEVRFKKLGLLVIDEEQRFGVAHKERLKELRKDIDVLTMSATPIPRTLHMSLSGIRDMSIINEPPGERYPVATYVAEYDENLIRDAIMKEIGRGGQVYYLYNRVEGIYREANRLAELVPDARVAVAHGQMHERELEEIMMEVSDGDIDILVCTTIIETGLDIANVNTIIIENADRLGLAQLYQLRGRVGRSNRLAYAYLTFRRNKALTEEAEKRLLAIKEFTEFGSGFKIAMRDLESRGTGNLIGAQQHGHLDAVGYEMYCQLLEQAVREQKGEPEQPETETLIDLPVSAFIPESYIQSHSQRIGAYKRIAAIDSVDGFYDVYDEIEDRYGTVPQTVHNLMEIAFIKNSARRCGIAEITGSSAQVIFRFDEKNLPPMQPVIDLISQSKGEMFLPNQDKPKLHYKLAKPSAGKESEYFNALHTVVDTINGEM